MFCPRCGLRQPVEHRFCVECGIVLPRDLLRRHGPKVSQLFRGIPVHPDDDPNGVLRVSRYLEEFAIETQEGAVRVPSHHVRFSVCALAAFLLASVVNGNGLEPTPAGH